jgi:hypothetical protein
VIFSALSASATSHLLIWHHHILPSRRHPVTIPGDGGSLAVWQLKDQAG